MTEHPTSVSDAVSMAGTDTEYRAGGTDLEARRHRGLAAGSTIDLAGIDGLDGIDASDAGAWIGAMTPIARLAADPLVTERYPALALTAGSLANPHTRSAGTLGGNLAQHVRCWYFRTGQVQCHMTGGDSCPARGGVDDWAVAFDTSDCIAPHPSSLAMALLVYDPVVELNGDTERSVSRGSRRWDRLDVAEWVGKLVDHRRSPASAVLGPSGPHIGGRLPEAFAEWPLVESVARLVIEDDTVAAAAVAVGAVARVPLRLGAVEERLVGTSAAPADLAAAADLAARDANPLPSTRYKVRLMVATVLEALERAVEGRTRSERTFERWL